MRRSGRGCRGCSKRKPAARKRPVLIHQSIAIRSIATVTAMSVVLVAFAMTTVLTAIITVAAIATIIATAFVAHVVTQCRRHRRHRLLNRPGSRCCRQRCGPTRYRPLRPGHRQWRLLCGCGGLHRPHRPLRHLRLRRSQNRCCRRSADRRPSRVPHPMLRLRLTQGCLPRRRR